MCGITGFLSERQPPEDVLLRMTRALAHRGPDAEGFHRDGPVAFGHRRLSVIDVAHSRQPMVDEATGVALCYNGELYNFVALRDELRAAGHRFETQGDTEVLLRALIHWGDAVLPRLRGMFAFAAWDPRRRRLLLARDQVGDKPLYYHRHDGTLVFGSELPALLEHPAVPREVDLEAVNLYLEGQFVPAPHSIWRSVRKLPQAHALVVEDGRLRAWRYWSLDWRDKPAIDDEQAVDLVDRALRESVGGMLVSDVPLGAFLSGGIDSSLVAAVMTECRGAPIDTYNLGFVGDVRGSEHEQAALVARHIGARHHPLMISSADVLAGFDRLTGVYDEPFADQAALPTLLLSAHARRDVTVVLTGEGADEVFAGYGNYYKRIRDEKLTRWLGAAGSPWPLVHRWLPEVARRERLLKAGSRPLAERYVTIPSMFDEEVRGRVYTPALRARTRERLATHAARFFDECNSDEYLDRLLHVDGSLWLPDDLLTKVDRATMACSLEARVPYLDHAFLQTCARLPARLKLAGRTTKFVLKQVARRYLPPSIVDRPKQGFMMPLDQWLVGGLAPLIDDALGPGGLAARNLVEPAQIARLRSEHAAGRRNHAMRLWTLLMLERWFRRFAPDFRL